MNSVFAEMSTKLLEEKVEPKTIVGLGIVN